jgi:hypothetical protein
MSHQISDTADDLNEQFVEKIRNKPYAIQINETNSTINTHLIMYARYVDENKIKENLLFYKEITETSNAEELFNITDSYVTTNFLEWSNCTGRVYR